MEAQGLATGSSDGKVQLWTSSLEMTVCIDVKALGPICHMVHSLSWDIINHKVGHRELLDLPIGFYLNGPVSHHSKICEGAWFGLGPWLAHVP